MATFALVTTVEPEPRPARSTPGEPGPAADRQAFASLSYSTNRQVMRNPHVGRPGFLVSMSLHPRTAFGVGGMRACFSYRIAKDSSHDPDILSLRQDRRNLASVSGRVKWRRAWNPAFGAGSSRRAAAQVRQMVHAQTLGDFPQPGTAGGEERPSNRPADSFCNRACQFSALLPSRSRTPASSPEITALPSRNNRPVYSTRSTGKAKGT